MARYDIGIVIVSYNVRHFLEQCLYSVQKAVTDKLSVEIWVVDNASVDGSVRSVQENFPEVHVIANDTNVGFSTANNQAIRQMDAKYVLLLNPDTVIEEQTLELCYDFMEKRPTAGAVGVRMIDGTGQFLPESKRDVPNLWNSFCKLSYLSEIFPKSKFFSGYNLGYLAENETHKISVLCGAFMFIRSEALQKTGLLDEQFFMYGEDIDLSYRIVQAGYDVWYYPQTSIIHYKGESTKKSSISYVKTFYGAMHIYVNKHYGTGNAKVFARVINSAVTVRAILSALGRIVKGLMRPLLDGMGIYLSLHLVKRFWAHYHFQDPNYYSDSRIPVIFLAYAFVWIIVLWLSGYYDKISGFLKRTTAMLTGSVIILIGYALLPETLRSSRAIILLGTFGGIVILSVLSYIYRWLFYRETTEDETKSIAIVAGKESGLKLSQTLKSVHSHSEFYYISPFNNDPNSWFTNSLESLPDVVRTLKINEVVYSSEDMTMKEIIRSMTEMGPSVTFKIGSDDSLSIVGSNDKDRQGELITLDMQYNLNSKTQKRYKRLTDFIVSLVMIPFLPALFIIGGLKISVILNVLRVLSGKATWVGYGGESDDYSFLPEIPKAVIKYPIQGRHLFYGDKHFKNSNIEYAKLFNIGKDLRVIVTNLFRLGNIPG